MHGVGLIRGSSFHPGWGFPEREGYIALIGATPTPPCPVLVRLPHIGNPIKNQPDTLSFQTIRIILSNDSP